MTVQILKSQIADVDFAVEVASYIEALKAWSKLEGVAPPTAHPLLEHAVKRVGEDGSPPDWVPDYEIVDDSPLPMEVKAKAIAASRQQEIAEIEALIPAGKQRLAQMDFNRAQKVPEATRSPAQLKIIQEWEELSDKIDQIRYAAAQREAAIEDDHGA